MASPRYVSKSLAVAADADGISLSQTPLAGGNLTITGALATAGVAYLTSQRRVLLTFASDETGRTFVVYGTAEGGKSISETVAGAASTAVTLQDFLTVTRISVDAATAGAITAGTNGVGSTPWQIINWDASQINLGMAVLVTGTVNFTWQYTFQDPSGTFPDGSAIPTAFSLSALASKAVDTDASMLTPIAAWRLQVNSGSGVAKCCIVQAGLTN